MLFLPKQSRGTITHSWCVTIKVAATATVFHNCRKTDQIPLITYVGKSQTAIEQWKAKSGNWYYLENLHPCTRLFFFSFLFFFFFLLSLIWGSKKIDFVWNLNFSSSHLLLFETCEDTNLSFGTNESHKLVNDIK